jgi:SH2 domain/Ankyrin repeats (3 copies)
LPQQLLAAGAPPTVRNTKNGRCPLHEAAEANNRSAMKVLLEDYNVPLLPYTVDGLSPVELAANANNIESIAYLNEFVPGPAKSSRSEWYHEVLSRESAEQVLLCQDLKPGMFLVRMSPAINDPVLTVYADRFYHYSISECGNLRHIGKGPHLPSLEHLIDHYSALKDGLPINLLFPVSPQKVVVNLMYDTLDQLYDNERIYYNTVGGGQP